MLLGQPPGGWRGTGGFGAGVTGLNPMLARFGAYQLQPYALPAAPPSLPPFVDPMRGGTYSPLQDPRIAYLLRMHRQVGGASPFGVPPFGMRGGGEGRQGPRGGVGTFGGGQSQHRAYDGGG